MKLPLWLSLLLALAGCAVQTVTPSPAATRLQPASTLPTAAVGGCVGVALTAVLRGDAADPNLAWIEQFPEGGDRQDVVWPEGFSARFTPTLEILDSTGHVVLRDGDFIEGTCGPVGGRLLLAPPFLALRLDCGPMSLWTCQPAARQVASSNGWPEHEIAELQFFSSAGRYRLVFEDGSTTTGSSSQP